MKPTKLQINEWLHIVYDKQTNPIVDFSAEQFVRNPKKYVKHFFIDLKSQIERWDLLTDYLFIHPQNMKSFISYFGSECEFHNTYEQGIPTPVPVIWGTSIIETVNIEPDKVLGYYNFDENEGGVLLENIEKGANIVVGNYNSEIIDRLDKIRAFW